MADSVKLTERAARKLAATNRRTEKTPRVKIREAAAGLNIGPLVYGIVTDEVSAADRTAGTLGIGYFDICEIRYHDDDTAHVIRSGPNVPLYSGAIDVIAVDRFVIAGPIGGRFNVVSDFCDP